MDRREALRLLSGAIAVPALSGYTAEGLLALGRRHHIRSQVPPGVRRFDPHQRAVIGAIAERIIPETDTPGARAAGVPEFIELVVAENFTDQERERFLAGVGEVDARSRKEAGSDFVTLPPAGQDRILSQLEAEAAPLMAQKPPEKKPVEPSQKPVEKPAEKPREARQEKPIEKPTPPFWAQIKFLTLYGYYTSKVGVVRELHTVVIPGRYDPCVATGVTGARGR